MLFRWVGSFLIGCFAMWGTSSAQAAVTKSQIQNQVKQLETSCRQKAWNQVSKLTQALIKIPKLKQYPSLLAKVHICLGQMFFQQKLKSLALRAFEKAIRSDAKQTLPVGGDGKVASFFSKVQSHIKKERAYYQTTIGKELLNVEVTSTPKSKGTHLGWLVGWPVAVAGVGVLVGAMGAGYNAYADSTEAFRLFHSSKERIADPLVTPTILSLQGRAEMYASISNVMYAVGGTLSIAAAGLIFWAVLSPKPTAKMANLPPSSTTPKQVFQPSSKVTVHAPNSQLIFKAE